MGLRGEKPLFHNACTPVYRSLLTQKVCCWKYTKTVSNNLERALIWPLFNINNMPSEKLMIVPTLSLNNKSQRVLTSLPDIVHKTVL